jgi:hypothetical protein
MAAIDAALNVDGDLSEVSDFITGIGLIEQRIRIRLLRGVGEWFLDPENTGLPFLEWRAQKPPDLDAISIRIQQEVLEVPGVVRVENFEALHDTSVRRVTVRGDVFVNQDDATTFVVIVGDTPARNLAILAIQFPSRSISGAIARPTTPGFRIG